MISFLGTDLWYSCQVAETSLAAPVRVSVISNATSLIGELGQVGESESDDIFVSRMETNELMITVASLLLFIV